MTQFAITNEVHKTLEIKKSQFICWIKQVTSRDEANAYLAEAKQAYPDARHHCWAYVMGDNAQSLTAAMSDDGEPSGTAGKPILNVLQHKPVNNVMAIVIRYFGGIKLGAGGLVRAYSQAVEQAFGELQLVEEVAMTRFKTTVDFADEQWLRHQIGLLMTANTATSDLQVDYHTAVDVSGAVPSSQFSELQRLLATKSYQLKVVDN